MSRTRAKKKQRQRARASAGGVSGRATGGASHGAGERARAPRSARGAAAEPAPRHPSRLEVRDGVRRPDAVWAPFPLTEIGMGVGLVLFVVGFAGAPAVLLAGVGVLVVVVAELCLREHFAGFRSHSILLAMLPVTIVHLGLVVIGDVRWRGPLARGDVAAQSGRPRRRAAQAGNASGVRSPGT
jgi:hypothetical protein